MPGTNAALCAARRQFVQEYYEEALYFPNHDFCAGRCHLREKSDAAEVYANPEPELMKKIFPFFYLFALIAAVASATGVVRGKDTPAEEAQEYFEKPLEKFCSLYWGVMIDDGAYCRFEQTFHFNRTHVGPSLLVTSVPVIVGDSLSVIASEAAKPVVGAREYAARSFVSDSEGYLSFRQENTQGLFSLQKINLRRCFFDSGDAIEAFVCPK